MAAHSSRGLRKGREGNETERWMKRRQGRGVRKIMLNSIITGVGPLYKDLQKGRAEKSTGLHFPVVTKQWELSSGAMADCGVGWDVGKFVVRCVKKDTN